MTLSTSAPPPRISRPRHHRRKNPIPRLDRRQLGAPVLASEGFHAGLHHRARRAGEAEAGIRQARRQDHGLSVDPVDRHAKWAKDIEETQGARPELSDDRRHRLQGLEALRHAAGVPPRAIRSPAPPADNQTVRTVFVIGPDKKIKLVLVYPMTTGRNFAEILRVIDSLQADRQASRGDAGRLEAGRGRHHRRLRHRRRGQDDLSARLEGAEALHPHRAAAEVGGCSSPEEAMRNPGLNQ